MKAKNIYTWLIIMLIAEPYLLYSQEMVHRFKVRTRPGLVLWNVADNINMWDLKQWFEPMEKEANNHFRRNLPFVKYVQLMTACGGNEQRDLFKNPLDRTVTDDYDFSSLTRACRNIVKQGLIPHIKLGNVPLKYSENPQISADFGVNVCPPYDYNLWHGYIKALMQSLVHDFGLQTVRDWRFGVLTEYENKSWFSVDNDPEKTKEAYFTLYDYTVDALEQVLGKKICVGAHSMTVSDGLWDEREFITHCARGKNRCTGKTGTRLCFLAGSYYELFPGIPNERTLPETINELRDVATKEGLNHLFYGIDEGRILNGMDKKPIDPRAIGQTWQAAFDARIYHLMLDENIDYFSHWWYTTNGILNGVPSIAMHTSGLFYKIAGSARLSVASETEDDRGQKTGAIAAINKKQKKLYLLFYAYSDSVSDNGNREIVCEIPDFWKKKHEVTAICTLISDDTNFFDDWLADWPRLGITNDDFDWSSDGFVIKPGLLGEEYLSHYMSCASLKPVKESLSVENGVLTIRKTIPVHGVLLCEIDL
jgi:hypothetical protein